MMGTITLQDSAHAIRRAFRFESGRLRDGTRARRVDAVHRLVFPASMRAGNRRIFPRVNRPRRTGVCLYSSFAVFDFQRHGNVKVRHALYLTSACRLSHLRVHAQFVAPTKVPDARPMSNDGKMEISFMSIKAMHPEWIPADLTGSLYLSRIADLSAWRTADDHTPRPPDITVAGATTDREWEYERAPHESQTVAVRRRGGAIGGSLVFGATSTMLGQSTGMVYQPGMAQSVALGDSDGPVALATPQQQYPPRYSSTVSSSAKKATPMQIPRGSGELGERCTKTRWASRMSMARGGIRVSLASDGQYRGRKRRSD